MDDTNMSDAYKLDGSPWKNRIVGHDNVPPDSLLANPHNFRIHPKNQQSALAGSLSELGWLQTVIVNQTTGQMLDGHLRVELALRNNEPTVPVTIVELTEAEEKLALATFDPITAMAAHDRDILESLLQDVQTADADLQQMLADLAAEAGLSFGDNGQGSEDAEPQIDRAEELRQQWGTELGQLWRLPSRTAGQEHRLICGDCTDAAVVERVMGGEKAKLVWTDPPYGVNYSGGMATPKSKRDPLVGDLDASLYAAFLKSTFQFVDPKAPLYLWYADLQTKEVFGALWNTGYQARCTIIWNKNVAQFGAISAQYKSKHEPMIYCHRKNESPYWYGPTTEVTVWDVDRSNKNEHHPTQKPPEITKRCLENSSRDGDLVADWFLGSGTTIIAAENLSRQCRAIEIAPGYVAVALDRYHRAFDIKPELVD